MQNKVDNNEEVLMLVEHHILDMGEDSRRDVFFSTNEVS